MSDTSFKLHLATENGKELPSHFRRRNEHLSDTGLALKYLAASMLCPRPFEAPTALSTSPSLPETKET